MVRGRHLGESWTATPGWTMKEYKMGWRAKGYKYPLFVKMTPLPTVVMCEGGLLLTFMVTTTGFVSSFEGTPLLWRTGRMLEIEAKAETPVHIGNHKRTCMPAKASGSLQYWVIWEERYLAIAISSHETFLKWMLCFKHPGPGFKAELPWEFFLYKTKECSHWLFRRSIGIFVINYHQFLH